MDYYKQIVESLWYRLQRHQFTCTQEQVDRAVNNLAGQTGQTPQTTALFLYWMLREGGKDNLPTAFISDITE